MNKFCLVLSKNRLKIQNIPETAYNNPNTPNAPRVSSRLPMSINYKDSAVVKLASNTVGFFRQKVIWVFFFCMSTTKWNEREDFFHYFLKIVAPVILSMVGGLFYFCRQWGSRNPLDVVPNKNEYSNLITNKISKKKVRKRSAVPDKAGAGPRRFFCFFRGVKQ